MSLSTCVHCGGHIPIGPDASNHCEDCGKFVFSSPVPSESHLPYETARRIQLLEAKLQAAEERLGEALSLQILSDSMIDGRDKHAIRLNDRISELEIRADAAEAEVAMLRTTVEPLFSQRELTKVIAERDALQAEVINLTEQIRLRDEACTDLETKLQAAEARVKELSEAPTASDRTRSVLYGEEIDRLQAEVARLTMNPVTHAETMVIACQEDRIAELEAGLRDLTGDCMVSDFNEHWDSFKKAEALLGGDE